MVQNYGWWHIRTRAPVTVSSRTGRRFLRPTGAVTVGPSSLAGRVTALGRLDEALRTLDEHGTALLVVGEPGIGKTALIHRGGPARARSWHARPRAVWPALRGEPALR